MAKKIILTVIFALLIGALGFCVCWTVINFNKVKEGMSGTALYTEEDIESSYKDGYYTGLKDKESLTREVGQLRTLLSEKEIQLSNLKNYVSECEATIQGLTKENNNLKAEIKRLETIIENLRASIRAYEELIESLPIIEERFVVTFMFDDSVYSILLVADGDKVEIEAPEDTAYCIFLGWSLSQDGELIDISEIEITSDTVIYAKIVRRYDVNFVHDFKIHENQIIEKGQATTVSDPISTDRRVFLGWSLDGVNIVDPATVPIWEHRTFYSVVETRHEVKFIQTKHFPYTNSTTLSTQYVANASDIVTPTDINVDGYTFDCWLVNGDLSERVINPKIHNLTGDVTFVAKYNTKSLSANNSASTSTSNMHARIDVLSYLKGHGHDYLVSMQQIDYFYIAIEFYADGARFQVVLTSSMPSYSMSCGSYSSGGQYGNLYCTLALTGNYLDMQLTFQGGNLLAKTFSGSFKIDYMNFTLRDL